MSDTTSFFVGFVLAGLVGFVANFLLKNWIATVKTWNSFFALPAPDYKNPPADSPPQTKLVGAKPDKSPLDILSDGCRQIFGRLFIQIFSLGIAFLICRSIVTGDDFLSSLSIDELSRGILAAGAAALHLNLVVVNGKHIRNLYQRIVNPPEPTLVAANVGREGEFHLGAKPKLSPVSIVIDGGIEILLRFIVLILVIGSFFVLVIGRLIIGSIS